MYILHFLKSEVGATGSILQAWLNVLSFKSGNFKYFKNFKYFILFKREF